MNALLTALSFLTIFPVPGKYARPGSSNISRSVVWYPIVGLLLGLLSAGIQVSLAPVFPWNLLAVIHVVLLTLYSGALHLDGLADTCDGFLSGKPRDKILLIMRDSRVGVMGVFGVTGIFLLKLAALACLPGSARWAALLLAPLCGRAGMLVHWHFLPYARPEGGLVSAFQKSHVAKACYLGAAFTSVGFWVLAGGKGLAVLLCCLIAVTAFSVLCNRKIGGMTGDTLGAACELCESAAFVGISLIFHVKT